MASDSRLQSFVEPWVKALEGVLQSMLPEPPKVGCQEPSAPFDPASKTGWSWYSVPLNLLDHAALWVGASQESWAGLGNAVCSALGIEPASEDDQEATCRDIIAQTASGLAQSLTGELGTEVTSGQAATSAPPSGAYCVELSIELANSVGGMSLVTAFDEALFEKLSQPAAEEPDEASADGPPTHVADLHFEVYVRLGHAELILGDVFKLTVGSVVELTQKITDPVDIMVNGQRIARGEVVVFNGNYGVKVTSRESRAGA